MNRYQIYIKPRTIDVLDDVAKIINISRSQLIRDVTDRAAKEFEKLIVKSQKMRVKNNPLLKMAGFAKGAGKDSQDIHQVYLAD